MIIHDRSWPHPVLSPFRDDVSPNDFHLSVDVDDDADNYYLNVEFQHNNNSLKQLIDSKHANYAVLVECRRNYFRRMYSSTEMKKRISIDSFQLAGRVEVAGFIKAQVPISNYRVDGAHPDYENATFVIEAGDVLAVARTMRFDAFQDYDPLKRIASILTIQRSEEREEGPMLLDTSGDKLVATLSQNDYDRYIELKPDPALGSLLANQVVLPALIEAVYDIKRTSEDEWDLEMGKRWFRSIVRKLEDRDIDVRVSTNSVMEIVQSLLALPLRRSLEGLLHLTAVDDTL
jgi:hypothetical protein